MSNSSLSQTALKGVLWASVEKFGGRLIQFVSTIILARILLPEDFGTIAMIMIIFAVASSLIDSGFSQALIREQKISESDKSTTFFINFTVAIVLIIAIWLLAPMVSEFYEKEVLTDLIRFMALTPLFFSLTIVQRAHFVHKINFRTQAYINLISSILSGGAAIYSATQGLGVWALAIQYVVLAFSNSVLFWIANPWIPKKFVNRESFNRLFGFGSKLMVSGIINVTFVQIYKVIIGKLYESSLLGFYAQAENIKNVVSENLVSVVARVNYPTLSKVKEDTERLEDAFKKVLRFTSYLIFPAMIGLILVAEPLVITLIGEKWIDSVPIIKVLCFSGMIHHLQVINLDMLKVLGRSDLFLKLEVIKKIGVTISIIVGINFGFWGLIVAQVVSSYISLFINMTYTAKLMGYGRIEQFMDIVPVFLLSVPMLIIIFLLGMINFESSALELIVLVTAGVLIYFLVSIIIKPASFKDAVYILRPKLKFLKHLKV